MVGSCKVLDNVLFPCESTCHGMAVTNFCWCFSVINMDLAAVMQLVGGLQNVGIAIGSYERSVGRRPTS